MKDRCAAVIREVFLTMEASQIVERVEKLLSNYLYIHPMATSVSVIFPAKHGLYFGSPMDSCNFHGAHGHIGASGSSQCSGIFTLLVGQGPSLVVICRMSLLFI